MTGSFWLDWAVMAISLTNTILLLWLGGTVLFNAQRRTWGAWVAGGGLVAAGIFFFIHSAVLSQGLLYALQRIKLWWYLGWVLVLALPLSWYIVILWYAGFWDDKKAPLYRRQRPLFWLVIALLGILVALLAFTRPATPDQITQAFVLESAFFVGSIPLVFLVYPLYILLCIALATDALRRPGRSLRVMGEIARNRARPWLAATSLALLAVSLLVSGTMWWLAENTGRGFIFSRTFVIAWLDLAIAVLIAAAVLALGQAVVSYEIFTGKTLPRRGFMRQWQRAIILAIGYGALVSWSLAANLLPIYGLLLTTVLMTVFYALLSWRSYTERERYIDDLRPFVASQGLFDQLRRPASTPPEIDLQTPFDALCGEVLGARVAYLVPIGPLAPLVGPPLTHPANRQPELGPVNSILEAAASPEPRCLPVDPDQFGGASWAVPLWSERGQIGVLLLGEKHDGGLYTQEEIEIAQTSGERLIDTRASAEIARRLMDLQRQRLAESQLLDQRARRVLHDEVLPQLHASMLRLVSERSKPNGETSEAIEMLASVHSQISDLLRDMPTTSLPEITKLGLLGALRKVVDEELGTSFEAVNWEIEPLAERRVQDISSLTAEVLYYAAREAIRNAARHGRKEGLSRPLHLDVSINWHAGLELCIQDDGVGVPDRGPSGDGQGLALHSTMMAVVGGELSVDSQPGQYTRVMLTLPQGK